jgi:beta-lactamase class A
MISISRLKNSISGMLHTTLEQQKRSHYAGFIILASIIFFTTGYSLGSYIQKGRYASFVQSFRNIRENSDKYQFINPLIGGVSAPATDVGVFDDSKAAVESYLASQKKQGDLYDYSFYFRDINSGLWFGVNENASFSPASLFKLPVAIAVYKEGEDDPTFLKKVLTYTPALAKENSSTELNADSILVPGQSYTVEQLVATMITASDNGAKDLLLSVLKKDYLNKLFAIVSLVDPSATQNYQISSIKYTLFFRVLYGSSYLTEEHSELLLGLLTKSSFKDGIVAGIPKDILVAHKYGMYEFPEFSKGVSRLVQQVHDCGVVYHSDRPYIVCFMTKGKDQATLFRIIAHVSEMVYQDQENGDH